MPFLQGNVVNVNTARTYDIFVPPTPPNPPPLPGTKLLPAIFVFHGGGQPIAEIEQRWGINPPNPVPPLLDDYILVFPETDSTLDDKWVHYHNTDLRFSTRDLDFVDALVTEVTTTAYATGIMGLTVSADPAKLYAAGFSSGGGMVWQIAHSTQLNGVFQGFGVVGSPLDPEKVDAFQQQLGAGVPMPPVPLIYVMGTADPGFRSPTTLQEVPLDFTRPYFTVERMLDRNGVPAGAAVTALVPGSANETEVVTQLFGGGGAAFENVTVINGGHNWPSAATTGNPPVATHFNATTEVVAFWKTHAGLP